ncbi:MAG TPA: cation:proton antiporter [Gammaproteobacteria bacterium]|nr:cation:proton antiporter [Gammaproteobacteria bacterium]
MPEGSVVFSIFLIFAGAAVAATAALYARQAMLVAYILMGVVLGPWGLKWVADPAWIGEVSHIGIIFLLYLLGLNMPTDQLVKMFREAVWVTLASSGIFAIPGFLIAAALGYGMLPAAVIGAVMMFSSTIIGLKLVPTTTLHHQRMGQVVISILLLQDLIAILMLLLLQGYGQGGSLFVHVGLLVLSLAALILVASLLEHFIVEKLIARFDRIHEYVFLLVIAWCLGLAELSKVLGLSHEIGAFVAGVALAASPVALFIAESLKPLRDFFLVLFFFSLGANFDLSVLREVALPAMLIAALALLSKPFVFRWLLSRAGEKPRVSLEIGVRLGQISEFSLLIAVVALKTNVIDDKISQIIEMATLVTFIISTYLIVMRYPTPIAISDRLRRD